MCWPMQRGVLNPLDASPPGSIWWRAMNERLLRDGCEAVGLLGGLSGGPSSAAVRLWLEFSARPTGRSWYRAHNASIVSGYLEHRNLAEAESAPERFFMNVAQVRVLCTRTPSSVRHLWPWVGRVGWVACSVTPDWEWPGCSCRSAACYRIGTRWCRTSSGTSMPSNFSVGSSTLP
jgi:hypothetical protein